MGDEPVHVALPSIAAAVTWLLLVEMEDGKLERMFVEMLFG